MPQAPGKFSAPWMPKRDKAERDRDFEKGRRKRHPWRNWYKLIAWKKIRERRLSEDPLCVMCLAKGLTVVATIVDHIVKHNGVRELFFSYANTQSLCKSCHDGEKQRMEARGEVKSPMPKPDQFHGIG